MDLEECLEIADKYVEEFSFNLDMVPQPYKDLYLISSLNFEISNGGVYQWLANQCGGYLEETISALRRVGAANVASILQSIADDFPDKLPKDDSERFALIKSQEKNLAQKWSEKGDLILEWPDDIDSLLRAYVKAKNE